MTAQFGRRGLPPEDDFEASVPTAHPDLPARARRLAPDIDLPVRSTPAEPGAARRGIVEDATEEEMAGEATRRGWLAVAALGVVIALVIGALWLAFGTKPSDTTVPAPPPSVAVTPSTAPSEPAPNSSAATNPPTVSLSPTEAVTPEESPTALETGSAPPPAEPASPSATQEAGTPAAPEATAVDLGDGAALVMPPEWDLYADELVQDARRLVRMRELATDVRIQAVTLTSVTDPLYDACLELVADHRQSYSDVAEGLPVAVAISGEGSGVSCNFTGTRISDSVPASVEFTLLQRGGITLVFRDTIPASVPEDSPALAQLVEMECGAAAGFGVTVDQCALIPGQADG